MKHRAPLLGLLLLCAACGDDTPPASGRAGGEAPGGGGASAGGAAAGGGGAGGAPIDPCGDSDLPEEDRGIGADPEAGEFTLEEALDGLPEGPGPLRAIIETELGTMTCELFPEVAPIGVANFVGLARGRRAFDRPGAGGWVRGQRYYDGLTFHRVIDDFMAQGGDPLGTGTGGPGYEFINEIAGESHTPGTLSYANAGPDTNGSQFFIVAEVSADFLDGGYSIFGRCAEIDVVQAITEVPTNASDKPLEDVHMTKVSITRCAP